MNAGNKSSDQETRARLLETAGRVFAEKGFRAATVREICSAAGANIAAVNYHFGDKSGLHAQAVQYWASIAHRKYPLEIVSKSDSSAEERLRLFVRSFLLRLLDESRPSWHAKLMAREMAEPTPALTKAVNRYYRPVVAQLGDIVREVMGNKFSDSAVSRTVNSILGQCLYYHFARPIILQLTPGQRFDLPEIEQLARHIAEFSLAALKGLPAKKAGRAR